MDEMVTVQLTLPRVMTLPTSPRAFLPVPNQASRSVKRLCGILDEAIDGWR